MKLVNDYFQKEKTNSLARNYMDACSNPSFKKFIDQLEIDEKLLIQYTSLLEDALCESENCQKCSSLAQCPNQIKGYAYTPKKERNRIIFSYQKCKKKQKAEALISYQKNINYFQIPKEIALASFKNLYQDSKARIPILKFFQEFMKDYLNGKKVKGLYLTGSFGSGKTYLIAALFNELAKKNVKSCMVYYPELLRQLKSSFHSSYEEKFETVRTSPLLLLDDIGAENMTVWARDEVLGPILQYRMDEGLPTFFTSNFTIEELETLLSSTGSANEKVKAKRITERIKQLSTVMILNSKNRRNE